MRARNRCGAGWMDEGSSKVSGENPGPATLLLTFPDLKQDAGADAEILSVWHDLVRMEIEADNEDDEF